MKASNTRSFTASGTVSKNDVFVPVIITGSYPRHEAEPTELTISPDMGAVNKDILRLLAGGNSTLYNRWKLQLSGRMTNGKLLWSPEVEILSHRHHRQRGGPEVEQIEWEATANFFVEGDLDEVDVSDGDLSIFLVTNPALLIPSVEPLLKSDGIEPVSERTLTWTMPLGRVEYSTTLSYLSAPSLGSNLTQYRVLNYLVRLKPEITGTISPKVLLMDLQEVFEPAFTLISLVSRKRVDWYEAELVFFPKRTSPFSDPHQVSVHRWTWLGRTFSDVPISLDNLPILKFEQLCDGLFEEMLASYRGLGLPYRSVFKNVLIHLLVSYEDVYIESKYISAYTALEALVSFFAEENEVHFSLGEQDFKTLHKRVKAVIKELLPGDDNKEKRALLYPKLSELRRPSFLEQLLNLANQYNLQLRRLWPNDNNYQEELRDIVLRRNSYIHQGTMDDLTIYMRDLRRIQNIIELWLLAIINVPQDVVNSAAIPSKS